MIPSPIRWPGYYAENGETITVSATLQNGYAATTEYFASGIMTSPADGWLEVPDSTYVVAANAVFSVICYITAPAEGPCFVDGYLVVSTVVSGDTLSYPIPIHVWTSPGPIERPGVYDTVASSDQWDGKAFGQYVALTASNHGEQGDQGIGGVNLDFVEGGVDCDDAATTYLYSGSPFVMIKRPGGVSITASYYNPNVGSGYCWVPLPGYPEAEGIGGAGGYEYDSLFTGRMANRDTTMWMERTYFAPRGEANLHNFVAVKTVVSVYETIWDSVAVGEASDWDIPSDALGNIGSPNTCYSGTAAGMPFVYLRGYSDTIGCTVNEQRFAANVFIGWYPSNRNAYDASPDFWGAAAVNVRDFFDADTVTDEPPTWLWDSLYQKPGITLEAGTIDLGEMLVFDYFSGWSAGSELVYWTVYVTGYEMADQAAVENEVAEAIRWTRRVSEAQCCVGLRGDIDGNGGFEPTLGDLTALVDMLFIGMGEPLCWEEANLDGSQPEGPGSLSLGDLTALVDILFITLNPPPPCP